MSAPKIEGKLNSKVLGEILRKLEQNRGAAYLLVSDGLSERCLYCSVGAIRLTSTGRRRAFRVEEKLQDHPRITPDIMRSARETSNNTGESIEEVLAGRMDLNDVLKECSSAIVRDEVLDLLLWGDAMFEFAESNPPPKIFDPRLEAVKLSLGATKLLKEAADNVQRTQKLMARVVGRTLVTRGAQWIDGKADGPAAQAILAAIPSEGVTFDELVLEVRRSSVDVLHFTDAFESLLDARRLEVPKKEKGTGLPKEEEQKLAQRDNIDIEATLEFIMNELAARQRLAKNYMVLGDHGRAVVNLKRVGDELFNRNRGEDAIDAYRQIIQLVPHDFAVREKVAFLFEKMRRMPEAIAEGIALAKLYKQFGLFNRARNAWRRVIGLDPEQVEHRKELIDLLVKMKERNEAIGEFESLAELYKKRHQDNEVLGVYKHLLALDPEHAEAKKSAQAVVRRRPGFWIPYAGVAAGFLVLVAAGAYVTGEYRALKAFHQAKKVAFDRYDANDFDGALASLREFRRDHGSSGAAARAESLEQQLSGLEQDRRVRRAEEEYGRARALEAKGSYPEARNIYALMLSTAKNTVWETKAQERIGDIDKKQDDAERKLAGIRRAENERNFRDAFDRARELVKSLPWTDAAQRLEVKLEVATSPAGARVTIDGRPATGTTPLIAQAKAVDPFTVTITLAGFATESRAIDMRNGDPTSPLTVELKRNLRWRQTLLGPIEATPLVDEDGVVIGGRDQRVYAFDAEGKLRWMRPLGLFADVTAQPLRAGRRVIVGDRTGVVTALDGASGRIEWRTKMRGSAAPLMARQSGDTILVSDEDGAIVSLEGATGKERARYRVPGGLTAAPTPIDADGTLVVPCGESFLAILDAGCAEKARIPTAGRVTAPVALTDKGFIVATEGDVVRSVSRDGKQAWQAKTPGAVVAQPLVADGAVFLGAGSWLVARELLDGQERFPKIQYSAAIRAKPAARGDRLYIPTGDGALHAVGTRTGVLRWTYRTQGEIVAAPVPVGETVFLASTDFGFYAIKD